MDDKNRNFKEEQELKARVKEETSLTGQLGNLANALKGGAVPQAAPSYSKGNQRENGVLKPEDHHIDISSMSGLPNVKTAESSGTGYKIGKGSGWGQSLLINNDLKTASAESSSESQPQQGIESADLGDLTPLIADVLSFNFSENRKQEVAQIHSAIKSELTKLSAKRVVANTQKKFTNAKQFFITASGSLRTEFTILGQKYSMLTKGAFTGNEILYPTVDGDIVVGLVMREGPDGLENATHDFEIQIQKGWKE